MDDNDKLLYIQNVYKRKNTNILIDKNAHLLLRYIICILDFLYYV